MAHTYMRSRQGTGRTTRMMLWALHLLRENPGATVYIVAFDGGHARSLFREYEREIPPGSRLIFTTSSDDLIDWENMTLRMHSNFQFFVLFDHAVIEQRYGKQITALFSWEDEETLNSMRTSTAKTRGQAATPIPRFARRKMR